MRNLIWVCLLLVASSKGFAGVVSIISPAVSPPVGDNFTLTVEATGMVELYAFQFDLSFDPSLLAVTGEQQGSLLAGSGGFIPGTIDPIGGTVTFTADTLSGPVAGVTGDGSLASFTFTALASGTSPLSLSNLILLDSHLADIVATTQNGSVTVAAASVPAPSTLWLLSAALAGIGLISKRRST